MTGPARTNPTTAAEVLRRQVLGAVAGKCISGASAEAATDAVMDVIAGLLADPTARTEWGVACDIHDEVSVADDREDAERIKAHHDAGMDHGHTIVRRTVTDWTPAEEGEHG